MTSTRNKNTIIDYRKEVKYNTNQFNHNIYTHSAYGRPTTECIPTIGYTPSHISRDALANNSVDIESALYGIGSTNLVNPCKPVNPSIRHIDFKEFFERRTEVIMPYPMIYNNNQRPYPI